MRVLYWSVDEYGTLPYSSQKPSNFSRELSHTKGLLAAKLLASSHVKDATGSTLRALVGSLVPPASDPKRFCDCGQRGSTLPVAATGQPSISASTRPSRRNAQASPLPPPAHPLFSLHLSYPYTAAHDITILLYSRTLWGMHALCKYSAHLIACILLGLGIGISIGTGTGTGLPIAPALINALTL